VEDIIAERESGGPFLNVYDFVCRINQKTVNKKSLENLICAGALDSFKDLHRAQYFYTPPVDPVSGLERLVKFGNQYQASSSMATNSLFGELAMPEVKPPVMPECEPWGLTDLLEREKEVVGIYISAHPLDGFKWELDHYGFLPINQIEANKGKTIRIAGYVSDAAHMVTKKGSKFGKFLLNDYTGHTEITLWEANYVQWGNFLDNGQKLVIQGVYQEHKYRPGVMEFMIQSITLLSAVRKTHTKRVTIALPIDKIDEEIVQFITSTVRENPGNTDLCIQITDEESNHKVRLRTNGQKFTPDDNFIRFLKEHSDVRYAIELV
jgi:DNA polymerase-3 subunit alpha